MNEAIQILLNSEKVNLPVSTAVYAIFSSANCRFVGVTDNLHQAMLAHFRPNEPNIPLRYFMQSVKPKILQYEVLKNTSSYEQLEAMKERWINLYAPAGNQAPCVAMEEQTQLA
jgi:hypothetical protein